MNVETKFSPHHTMPLSSLLLPAAPLDHVEVSPSEFDDDVDRARDMLRHALKFHQEQPAVMPIEYLVKNGIQEGVVNDVVMNQKFKVAPAKNVSTLHHSNLQRVLGYSGDYLLLEDLPKGLVSSFLENAKGRLQLHAQRRITIMLEVVRVMEFLHKEGLFGNGISSSNIGLTLDLTPKLCRTPQLADADDIHDFGILMIELLTGSLQNDAGDRKFGDLGQRYASGKFLLEDDLDPYVRESWTFNILSQLVELALACVSEEKPTMHKLVETLTLISQRNSIVENYDWY